MVLSNIVKDGKPIGIGDAGQDWHTDMSYSETVAFVNVLFALEVPRKEGATLGATHFSDMARPGTRFRRTSRPRSKGGGSCTTSRSSGR